MESIARKQPRTRGPRRGRGVRVRGGITRTDRPGPRTIDEIIIYDITDMPVGVGLERPLHPYRQRNRRKQNFSSYTTKDYNIEKATPSSVAQDSKATTVYNIEKATPSSVAQDSKAAMVYNIVEAGPSSVAQDSYTTMDYKIEKATPSSKSKSKVKVKKSFAQNSYTTTDYNIVEAGPSSVAQDSYTTMDYKIEKATPSSKSKSKVKVKKSFAQNFSSYATTVYNIVEAGPSSVAQDFSTSAATVYNLEKATPSSVAQDSDATMDIMDNIVEAGPSSVAQDSYTATDYNIVEAGPSSVAQDSDATTDIMDDIVEGGPSSVAQDSDATTDIMDDIVEAGPSSVAQDLYTTTDYNIVEAGPSSVAQDSDATMDIMDDIVEAGPSSVAQDSYTTTDYNILEAGPSSVAQEEQAQIDPILIEIKLEAPVQDLNDNNGELAPSSATQVRSQSLREKITFEEFGYGSEEDSGDSDDGEMPPLFIPRAQLSVLETPIDDDDDDQPTAEPEPAAEHAAASTSTLDVPPKATEQPWNLFDFDWKPFPNVPIPPKSRRETFSHNDVGPTIPCVDPYDIFICIWDRQFMEYIVSETNRYAQQLADRMFDTSLHPTSRINRWRDTTVDELYVYFALVIGMGIVVKTRVDEYWSATADLFHTPNFSTYMSYSRFVLLGRCLHFANNENMYRQKLDSAEAKLFKIQPVLSHLNNKFQSLYRLKQNIALDESLLMWKGCLNIRQLIPNKKAKMGIKTYEICESQTGYLWRFEVHTCNSRSRQHEDPLIASTPAIVLKLVQGLEGKGHTLWMDNFYNSPCLARRLKSLGLDCVGTLRTNRKFVPHALHSLTKEDMLPGQISGLTAGDVDVMVWRDNNKVAMISTYHGNAVSQLGSATKPILIHDYNIMMGGVDKKDQMLSMFQIERKRTKTWYKTLFRRLLNISVLNSFIIHHQSSSPTHTHRSFRKALVSTILSKHFPKIILKLPPVKPTKDELFHRLAEYPFAGKQRKRRRCVKCSKLVRTFCPGCQKTVCMDPCFLSLHK